MEQATTTYDLLERLGKGDDSAFTPLFERYQKRLAMLIHYFSSNFTNSTAIGSPSNFDFASVVPR